MKLENLIFYIPVFNLSYIDFWLINRLYNGIGKILYLKILNYEIYYKYIVVFIL